MEANGVSGRARNRRRTDALSKPKLRDIISQCKVPLGPLFPSFQELGLVKKCDAKDFRVPFTMAPRTSQKMYPETEVTI